MNNGIGMALGVARDGQTKIIPMLPPDKFNEVEGALEAALGGFPLLLAVGRIPSLRDNISNIIVLARLESFDDVFAFYIGAREVHVRFQS